jgi:hypothetical protein
MRTGISVTVTPEDRLRLEGIARDRNTPQKHVWRARIILLTADGVGTTGIMAATGKDKTCAWRWQARFMDEGVEGLVRDKTRPSRIPPVPLATIERVVALTNTEPAHEATHWTAAAWPRRRISASPRCSASGRPTAYGPTACAPSSSPTIRSSPTS